MESLLLDTVRKSRIPAKLDFYQSATGLILGLFMWVHMLMVSSILLGKDAMKFVAGMLEGSILRGEGDHGYPILVTLAAMGIFTLFIIHAALAVRKFPANWKQHKVFRQQMSMMNHDDTNYWYTQFITGFIMFFLGSVHLFIIMTHPDKIGPYASADRVVSEWMWPLYLVLLFAVEFHGTIGLYRLAVKWGWFDGADPRATRKKLKAFKKALTIFFVVLGLASLGAYVKIGVEQINNDNVGGRYTRVSSTNQ
ncbi:MAG: succinate dehydrogenase/fumarate reductase cytochrome b subunit [SAR324 cluster bacterium]|uniref:Succinate dehydrogenase/fumarate reductase cytochrome b subunit n=1 Tax=SAR324 cluster bacterium TaxID=2024889 RepID=A0A2A4TAY8_9DELT|nr:MAG: succinate dehydrogenase/fumarate reductase cytochrome b subunit [SAR324 cluster bacterium]